MPFCQKAQHQMIEGRDGEVSGWVTALVSVWFEVKSFELCGKSERDALILWPALGQI